MSVRRVVQIAASGPWSRRRQQSSPVEQQDEARRPLLKLSSPLSANLPLYGSTDRLTSSPGAYRRESFLGQVPEEDQVTGDSQDGEENEEITADEVEFALEEQGLYGGSYRRRVTLYTFIPLSSLLVFVTFAPLPTMLGPVEGSKPLPHAPYFPFPIPELLVSVSLWSLVHLLRLPLYNFTSLLLPRFPPFLVAFIYNFVYSTIVNTIRISAFPILRVRHQMDYLYPVYRDFAFRRVWWLALGFAAFDAVVGIAQDYSQIALYKTVMIPEENIAEVVNQENTDGSNIHGGVEPSYENEVHPMSPRLEASLSSNLVLSRVESDGSTDPFGHSRGLSEELEREVDHDIEQLVSLKEREDVEQIYGLPIIRIPVFILCLQRIDSIVVTVGITLTLSACYLQSNISFPTTSFPSVSSNRPIAIAFPLVCLLNLFLALLYTPTILPKVGVHTSAYIGFLIGLGVLFTGLGLWGVLS